MINYIRKNTDEVFSGVTRNLMKKCSTRNGCVQMEHWNAFGTKILKISRSRSKINKSGFVKIVSRLMPPEGRNAARLLSLTALFFVRRFWYLFICWQSFVFLEALRGVFLTLCLNLYNICCNPICT